MMKRNRAAGAFILSGLIGSACLLLAGCGHGPAVQRYQVVVPDELMADGSKWQKQLWSPKDDRYLAAYFREHPYVAENPGFSGEKVCYANGAGVRRYYWVSAVDDTCQWLLLEFRGAQATGVVEGLGEPFVELARKE